MFAFFANTFGYVLNFIYEIVNNYGLAIILFSIIVKIVLLPISIKQQRTMEKSAKLQGKLKELQFKYKNNPEMLNKETIALYKNEKMSPFSGCFSSIIQMILLLSVFFLVQSPLTYMRKVDTTVVEEYKNQIISQGESNSNVKYPEIQIIQQYGSEDERVYMNMQFLGLDLSLVPISSLNDYRVFVIPILYVISSFISMKISTNLTKKKKIKKAEEGEGEKKNEVDAIEEANKNMMYIMPVMAVSISLIAPLGLALYWLVNNILMIVERVLMNKFLKTEGEENA
ncbi:MAG: YidC/Oxa1 family membrane protein insertase [Clostridia bacterium]|nr:YidC/Oxa1 family membrane protein insertase [Clostridia bacterium]